MLRKCIILFLTIGFFAIVPQAIADDQTEVTSTAPTKFRVLANEQIVLLTLQVHNIQVQERWHILSEQSNALTIVGGTLSSRGIAPPTVIIATIVVEDMFQKLNPNYANLSLQITVTLEFLSNTQLPPILLLRALFGQAITIHTLPLGYTYSLLNNATLFAIDDNRFFTSLGNAIVGLYTITIQAQGDDASIEEEEVIAHVQIYPILSLDDAPPLEFEFTSVTAATVPLVLHTFTVTGGIENKTYTLIAAPEQYFSLRSDGVLSLIDNQIPPDAYTMTIRAIDEGNNSIDALATVRILPHAGLTDLSLRRALFGQTITLYTLSVADIYTYSVLNYTTLFAIDDNRFFTSQGNATVGLYTITIQAQRGTITDQGIASVRIYPTLSLDDASPLTLDATLVMTETPISLHTFMAHGGIENKTYILIAEHANYFSLGSNGILSLVANQIPPGVYTMTIRAIDERNNSIDALAMVRIVPPLVLDGVTLDISAESFADIQHTLIAAGGFGNKTYTIIAGNDDRYFALSDHGVLSLTATITAGFYTLSIQVTDDRDYAATARAVIEVTDLYIADAPPGLSAVEGKMKVLHTFMPIGATTGLSYTIIAGNTSYFSVTDSGILSVGVDATVGLYTLVVQVRNDQDNSNRARAVIEITPPLPDSPFWRALFGQAITLDTLPLRYTYSLLNHETLFAIEHNRFTSLGHAIVGLYTITIQAQNGTNIEKVTARVQIYPALSLDDAPPLEFESTFVTAATVPLSLHTFTVTGGIEGKTYTLITAPEQYFSLGSDGVLSLVANQIPIGVYTMTIRAIDEDNNSIDALATVRIIPHSGLTDLSLWRALFGQIITLYTLSVVDIYTYSVLNHATLFAIDDNGFFTSRGHATVGLYTITIQAQSGTITDQVIASVRIYPTLSLDDASPLTLDATLVMTETPISLHTFMAHGGIEDKTYTLIAEHANYFSLGSNGILSLTSNQIPPGVYTMTIRAIDEGNNFIDALAMVRIVPPLVLGDVALDISAENFANIQHTLIAAGGFGNKTYTIIAGNDDHYFALSDDGVLSLTATITAGFYTLSIQVTDDRDYAATARAVIEITDLSIADVSLSVVVGKITVLHTFIPDGATTGLSYMIIAGNTPGYFSVNDSGVLSAEGGATVGFYTLTVQVHNDQNNSNQARAVIEVIPSLSITLLPTNVSITDVSLSVVAGKITVLHTFIPDGAPTGLSFTIIAGNTPGYFSVTDSGVLSAQGGATVGVYTLTVQVHNNQNKNSQVRAVIEVTPSLSFTQAPIIYSWASITARVHHTFQARGGEGAIAYTLAADTDYFKIDAQGHLSLVAAMVGIYTLTIQATTAYDDRATVKATIHLAAPIVFADIPPLYVIVGPAQNLHTLTASGGFGKSYDIPDSPAPFLSLKNGILAINANNSKGSFTINIRAYDTKARDQQGRLFTSATATVHIFSPLSLTAPPYTNFTEGDATNLYTVIAYDGFGDHTYHLAGGNSANHFTLGVSSGVLEIQPTAAAGRYTLSLAVSDVANNTYGILVTVEVVDNLVLAEVPWLDGVVGNAANLYTLSVSGGGQKKTFAIAGANYFTLDGDSRILSIPSNTSVGRYTLVVKVSDEHGYEYAIQVVAELVDPISLASVPLLVTEAEEAINLYTLSATGGGAMKTYTVTGNNAQHFTMGPTSGVLAVNANTPVMVYTLSVAVRDQYGNQAQVLVMVDIITHISLAAVPSLLAVEGPMVKLHTLSMASGRGVATYQILSGNGGGHFTLGNNDGVLVVNANAAPADYELRIEARDQYGNTDEVVVTVKIVAPLSLSVPELNIAAQHAADLYTLSVSGGGVERTYAIVDGNQANHFILNNGNVLAVKNSAPPSTYRILIQVSNEYNSQTQTWVTVYVETRSLQGYSRFNQFEDPKGDESYDGPQYTVFRFAGQLSNLNNYYIYYRGRYFNPTNIDTYDPANGDPYIEAQIRDYVIAIGSRLNFWLVHKSLVVGNEAKRKGYIHLTQYLDGNYSDNCWVTRPHEFATVSGESMLWFELADKLEKTNLTYSRPNYNGDADLWGTNGERRKDISNGSGDYVFIISEAIGPENSLPF